MTLRLRNCIGGSDSLGGGPRLRLSYRLRK